MFSSRRGHIAFVFRFILFLALFATVAEVWFRTVTPACETPGYYQDDKWLIWRYDPRGPREGLFTVGRLAARGGKWRVNNDGWISAVDYFSPAQRARPLVALFGDSYVEGFLTDVEEHVDPCLSDALGGCVDVYAFGMSGWYLEQYVATSRYVADAYSPDVLVVFVGNGDIAASLAGPGESHPNLWTVRSDGAEFVEVEPRDIYQGRWASRAAKCSAIVNYLRFNAKVALPGMRIANLGDASEGGSTVAQDGDSEEPESSWQEYLPVAQYLVDQMCQANPGTPIIFVARTGDRYQTLEELAQTGLFSEGEAIRMACGTQSNCYFLDLRGAFCQDWRENKRIFEAADGAHWNGYANRLVAETLAAFIEENDLITGEQAVESITDALIGVDP